MRLFQKMKLRAIGLLFFSLIFHASMFTMTQMYRLFLVFLFLGFSSHCLQAQVIRQNEKGEKIIVYPDGSWRYFNQTGGGKDYPVYQAQVLPFEQPVMLTEEDARKIANRQAQLAREAASIAQARAEKATEQRLKLEAEMRQVNRSDAEALRHLQVRLEASKRTESESLAEVGLAKTELTTAEELTHKGDILSIFKKAQAERDQKVYAPNANALSVDLFASVLPSTSYYDDFARANPYGKLPVPAPCRFAFEGKDPNNGRTRRDLESQQLFSFTDEKLKLFLKDKEYLSCKGFLSSVDGGFRVLTLEFSFSSPNAREAYGFIEKGSILTIRLLNGGFINLQSGSMDRGSFDTQSHTLVYRVTYNISADQLGFLEKNEVDKIRVFWSSGYEEYEVYQMDFFMRQLKCLDK
jgi:hypothetical protein